MTYEEWEGKVPDNVRAHPMWSLRVYRTALYAGELGRRDAAWLREKADFAHIADQMARATASISANIAEGYSRLGRKDRGKFYEYALGSARESRDWYYKAREPLGDSATDARYSLLTTIIKIMIVLVSRSRVSPQVKTGTDP